LASVLTKGRCQPEGKWKMRNQLPSQGDMPGAWMEFASCLYSILPPTIAAGGKILPAKAVGSDLTVGDLTDGDLTDGDPTDGTTRPMTQ
jgi:hypothetical protein